MTIQQAFFDLTTRLRTIYENGEAETISDWIMESLTGAKRADRISRTDKSLTPEHESQLKEWTKRLIQHEPVQYVLNEAWFCGLKFYVDKRVLIPRPETEELVEWIISDCKFPVGQLSILDIGSGSGCIPVAVKKRLPKTQVWSCDVSETALEVAKKNATSLGIDVNFFRLDFLSAEKRNSLPTFDIIVSNPPYIPVKDKFTMHKNILGFEPETALFVPDDDALVFYKAIADFGISHLKKKGVIYTEIHEDLGGPTTAIFQQYGYTTELKKDMQGKERMVKAFIS